VKVQDTNSNTSQAYKSLVKSLKELEEVVEECNSIHLSSMCGIFRIEFSYRIGFDKHIVLELDMTKKLIEL